MGRAERSGCARRDLAAGFGFFALMAFAGCEGLPEIPVTLTEFAFEPKPIAVPASKKIAIVLQNKGTVEHVFAIAQFRIASDPIPPGKTARLEFAVPNGIYKVTCTIPGHEEMVGEVRATRAVASTGSPTPR